ncbi:mas-related G-protein coupled receptor member X1-like [Echinops telfairi]|uniref:Mas-related G-protein coupled receptor member X1-like n=1 Tax=Echinops telfairi TaxID=9371 RepID=A0AC55D5Q3_ECHTE|nr:mas-related G-protein coupled receptor member X1-like [Echinops telfairi]
MKVLDPALLILICLMLIIALGGLAGNLVVLWILGFHLQRNSFLVYILNLAMTDCAFLCVLIVFSLVEILKYFDPASNRFMVSIVIVFLYFTDMSILSAIGTERCLSVLCPIWYRCHRPSYMSAVTCALLWALSLLLTLLKWYYCEVSFDCCWPFNFFLWGWVIFLSVVLCGSSLLLLVKVFYGSRRRKMTRLLVTILITVLVFLLCGLPFGTYCLLVSWIQNKFCKLVYFVSSLLLCCMNSSANPIIYFFVGSYRQEKQQKQLQKLSLKVVLQRALQDTPEGAGNGGGPPQESLELSGSQEVQC